ncbi:MAG TPA: hypothetical protein PLH84_03380 [Candidatus Krumholzibacteria bacterium]|nr:hypothetical protein [Candidatus Krumholzibacteria bacterium]
MAAPRSASKIPRGGPTGARLWLARLALALGLPLLLLLGLEGALRLAGSGYPATLALKVPGTDRYGINLRYGWRFFPKEIARGPLFFSFPQEKPADACRIVVLGASAAQGYPRGALGFSRVLEAMLADAYPDTEFEVINTAIVATNSHVCRTTAREFAGYDPDVYVVYLGNNEVIGPYGLGASRDGQATPLGVARAGIALKGTRVGQLAHGVAERFAGRDEMLETWAGMEMYAKHQVRRDSAALERVRANFRANLHDIAAAGEGAGARVVLSTVAVNVWDGAPFASAHREGLSQGDLEAWTSHFDRGVEEAAAGRTEAALEAFAAAAALDDTHAELAWRRGRALLAAGDTAAAGEQFQRAKELDVLRFRCDDALNQVIRDVAADPSLPRTELADAAAAFAAAGPDLAPDPLDRRFYEHVHLTYAGNHALAAALFPAVAAALPARVRGERPVPEPLDADACAAVILESDWEDLLAVGQVVELLDDPPFPQRADHADLTARWRGVAADLQAGLSRARLTALLPEYERRIAARPHDDITRTMYADLLRAVGDHGRAKRVWQQIRGHQPPAEWLED